MKYAQGDITEAGIEEKMQKQFYLNDESTVRNIANQVIAYYKGIATDAARSADFNANWTLLYAFCQKLVAILGPDTVTAAFPNADWNLNTVINGSDPIVPVSGASVTLTSLGSFFFSTNPGAINSTQFV